MPTVPTPPADQPHRHRGMAESFGVDPDRYDRSRPAYPDDLVKRIVAASPGPDVLDVGIGTGTAARQFRSAGCTVLGVEPDARMADFARRGGFAVEVATFEDWDPAGRTFDAVVAAQSWHWVDPVAGAAKAAQVLRAGGRLAVFGHVYQPPSDVMEAFATTFRRLQPDSPLQLQRTSNAVEAYQTFFARAADAMREVGFGAPESGRFDRERRYTRAEWLDLLPTQGANTRLPPDQMAEISHAVGAAIDARGGSFTMHFTTLAAIAPRSGGA